MAVALMAATVAGARAAHADVVYDGFGAPTGLFTPFFTGSNQLTHTFGDSGWVMGPNEPAITGINSVILGLAVYSSSFAAIPAGKTDIKFTFNDGDPSGLVFGTGTTLYSTTLKNVELPAIDPQVSNSAIFELVVPIDFVSTLGGYNNVGFGISVENFDYQGQFGFQTTSSALPLGFSTINASEFNGSSWSLYSFNGGANLPFRVVNVIPEPTAALPFVAVAGLALARRRK